MFKKKRNKEEIVKEMEELKKIIEPPTPAPAIQKPQPTARIISMELLSSGLIETTLVSNSSMGELGDEFDI